MIIDGKEFDDAILEGAFGKVLSRKSDAFELADLVKAFTEAGITGMHKGWEIQSELANRFLQKKRKAGILTYVHKGRLWKRSEFVA